MAQKQEDRPNTNRRIHPPLVALFCIVVALILGRFVTIPLATPQIVTNIGFALTFIGFLLGVGALIEFRKARTTLDPHSSVNNLVMSGVYRFTRNPIYLGFLFMVIGLPLNYGYYWGIVIAPIFVILINRLVIKKEEAYLEKKFKEQYTSYRSRVRRWL
jgi:protein-S-isoprenylcysteine O-methyltransferase Ste14